MSGPEFFQTKMGHAFYEGTMPAIARSLKSIAESLEKIANPLVELSPTGRALSQPNPQNIVIRTRLGAEVREAYNADHPVSNKCHYCGRDMTKCPLPEEACGMYYGIHIETPHPDEVPGDLKAVLEANEDILDEVIHDSMSKQASEINNGGWDTQVEFLRANGWSWNEIRKAVGCAIPFDADAATLKDSDIPDDLKAVNEIRKMAGRTPAFSEEDARKHLKSTEMLAFRDNAALVLSNVNWPLLHEQKKDLLSVIFYDKDGGRSKDPIQGIVNLIDALQDAAHRAGIWKFPEEQA